MSNRSLPPPDYALAPVLIATHTRVDHLTETINALKKNLWSDHTDLYIFSDAAEHDYQKEKVNQVRDYIKTISGFKSLNLIIRDQNYGHFNNFQNATDYIFTKYEKVIKLEDDIVTGRHFLKFMNEALNLYSDDNNVVSISGYFWDNLNLDVNEDSVLLPIMSGWGWATWRNRFYLVDHSPKQAKDFLRSPYLLFKMLKLNPTLLGNVYSSSIGRLKAGDVNWALHILKYHKCVLFPTRSLVRNIGFDGTGQNCGAIPQLLKQEVFDKPLTLKKLDSDNLNVHNRIIFKYFGGYKHLIKQLILYYTEKLFGRKFLLVLLKVKKQFSAT